MREPTWPPPNRWVALVFLDCPACQGDLEVLQEFRGYGPTEGDRLRCSACEWSGWLRSDVMSWRASTGS